MPLTPEQRSRGLVVAVAAGVLSAGLVLVLSHHSSPSDQVSTGPVATQSPTPEATPTDEPTPTESPTGTPTPDLTPTETPVAEVTLSPSPVDTPAGTVVTEAPSPTPSPTRSPSPKPTPKPTASLPDPHETIEVSVHCPSTASVNQKFTCTMNVSWDKQPTDSNSFSFKPAGQKGCTRPTTPPSHSGPGSETIPGTWSYSKAGTYPINAVAALYCGYYEGYAQSDDVTITVS